MFGKHKKRSANTLFVIFRLILSMVMIAILLAGIYSAYKHFSGLDPLKLDPLAIASGLIKAKSPEQVLGVLASLKIGKNPEDSNKDQNDLLSRIITAQPKPSPKPLFKFLALSDSHSDNINLKKAISQAKEKYPDIQFIIGLGDYTEVGTVEELQRAKQEFDLSNLRYFVIPGDHDLWDSRDKQNEALNNFHNTFGPPYQAFTYEDFRFLLLDNSDNYKGVGEKQQQWISEELNKKEGGKGIIIFIHEPLYHPSSDHFMGRVEGSLKQQAKSLVYQFKAAGVRAVISGDIHFFSEYLEPETSLSMVTVGAITSERNPQAPRYSIVWVFDDGSVKVEDVEIK